MKLCFYVARYGTWIDRAIAAHDRGWTSHVELCFPDGEWFSSSWRDGGTRFKRIDAKLCHWRFLDVPATREYEQAVRTWCEGQLGYGYDISGVLSFRLPFYRPHPEKWYCSELAATVLQHTHLISRDFDASRISPNGLYKQARYNWG